MTDLQGQGIGEEKRDVSGPRNYGNGTPSALRRVMIHYFQLRTSAFSRRSCDKDDCKAEHRWLIDKSGSLWSHARAKRRYNIIKPFVNRLRGITKVGQPLFVFFHLSRPSWIRSSGSGIWKAPWGVVLKRCWLIKPNRFETGNFFNDFGNLLGFNKTTLRASCLFWTNHWRPVALITLSFRLFLFN